MEPVRFTFFASASPSSQGNVNCVSLSHISQWAWVSRRCTARVLFVCQKGKCRSDLYRTQAAYVCTCVAAQRVSVCVQT